ncbi:MAG: hypothetical protein AB1705_25050 [Verrucomicrobiota bacterium]
MTIRPENGTSYDGTAALNTLWVAVRDFEILTLEFIAFVQDWQKEAHDRWRVIIPTYMTDNEMIVIYPNDTKINEIAEKDLNLFLAELRTKLPNAYASARRELGMV